MSVERPAELDTTHAGGKHASNWAYVLVILVLHLTSDPTIAWLFVAVFAVVGASLGVPLLAVVVVDLVTGSTGWAAVAGVLTAVGMTVGIVRLAFRRTRRPAGE